MFNNGSLNWLRTGRDGSEVNSGERVYIGDKHICGKELYSIDDGVTLGAFRPKKQTYCDCGYTGFTSMAVFNASKCYHEQVKRG